MPKTVRPDISHLSSLNCRTGAARLAAAALRDYARQLEGWDCTSKRLRKTYAFDNYYQTMAFVNAIAFIAHQQDHHPDLGVHYNRATVTYATHDTGGVTLNDCICAAKVERLLSSS